MKYSNDQKSSMKVSDLESRNGSLEKEVATKDIKELEDLMDEVKKVKNESKPAYEEIGRLKIKISENDDGDFRILGKG